MLRYKLKYLFIWIRVELTQVVSTEVIVQFRG